MMVAIIFFFIAAQFFALQEALSERKSKRALIHCVILCCLFVAMHFAVTP